MARPGVGKVIIRGHIKNGVAVLDEPVSLPEGTAVRIEVDSAPTTFWQTKPLQELTAEQAGRPLGSPDDLAGSEPGDDSIDDFLAWIRKARA